MKDILPRALVELAPAILTAVSGGLTWLLVMLGNYFRAKGANSRMAGVLAMLDEKVIAIVRDIEATLKAQLELARADGVITAEEGRGLRDAAMERLKASLGGHGLDLLQKVLGLGSSALDNFLGGKLEGAVAAVSAQKRLAEAPVSPLLPH